MKEWQKNPWPRHIGTVPAENGIPYRYDAARNGNGYWPYPRMTGWVSRAIVADGSVGSRPTWESSPQVRVWMDDAKPGLLKRFRAWLDK